MKKFLKILGVLFLILTVSLGLLWIRGVNEREDAAKLEIYDVDFSALDDGTYYGYYPGGIHGYRENAVEITIENGMLIKIENIINAENKDDIFLNELYNKVIVFQTLDIDATAGATLTTKAYLKSIENACNDAQNIN